jgi:hypothetical protein
LRKEPGGLTYDANSKKLSILAKYDIKEKEGIKISNKFNNSP